MASLTDDLVQQLLAGRHVASLATVNPDSSIHMVAVWFWFDGSQIFVATSSRSRKAQNLQSNAKAALMIDSRDPDASCGVTIAGTTRILTGDLSRQKNAEVHRKYLSAAALADPKVGPVLEAFCPRLGRAFREELHSRSRRSPWLLAREPPRHPPKRRLPPLLRKEGSQGRVL